LSRPRSALLLVGSPRGARSTSASLGGYLLERLAGQGVTASARFVEDLPSAATQDHGLPAAARAADLLIASFPLYVDALPAPVTRAMEAIAAGRLQDRATGGRRDFVAMVNCGFPEAQQAEVALAICRRFAAAAGFCWLGGLAMGLGGTLGGRPLGQGDGRFGHVEEGLDLAAAALARGEAVPERAVRLLARPIVPPARFVAMGNRYWSAKAAARGIQDRLRDRPYQR